MGREVEEWVSGWVDGFEVGCWDSRDVIHRKGKGRRKIYFTPAAGNLPKAPELVQVCSFLTRV